MPSETGCPGSVMRMPADRPACAASREGAEDQRGRGGAGILVADAARAEVARPALQRLHGYGRRRAGRRPPRRARKGRRPATPPPRSPCRTPWSPAPARRPWSCRPRGRRRAAGRPRGPPRARRPARPGRRRRRLPAPSRPGGTPCRRAGRRRRRPWRSACCPSGSGPPRASRLRPPRRPARASTAVKPRDRLMPWSASPIAASSWVRWSRLASIDLGGRGDPGAEDFSVHDAPCWESWPSVPTAGPGVSTGASHSRVSCR